MTLRHYLAPIALALAIGMSSCTTLDAILHPNDTQVQIVAEKSLATAHDVHALFAYSASAAAKSGTCIGACAVKVREYLDKSYALLLEADQVSDATTIASKVAEAIDLINKAKEYLK